MSISLFKAFVQGMTDYISRHNANYTLIESEINYLLSMITGAAAGGLSVPAGLKEIFDRTGIIGQDSYGFAEGALSGPSYNMAVSAGAYWNQISFMSKITATNVSMAGKLTGTYYLYLDSSGIPNVSDAPQADTIYSFDYDSGTHAVSNKTLYAGVAILFDGDDYADQLTSAARAKNFTSVAQRLEEIEQLLGTMAGYYAEDPDNHDGLDFAYKAGQVRNDSDFYDTPAGAVTLTDDETNYVELDPTDGSVSANTTIFTSGLIGLFIVVTASGAIDTVTDKRTWVLAGTGGGGGGHTQNTDTGTTSPSFTLNHDAAGAPSDNCELAVERGTSPNVSIRWNESLDKWQYSNDGESWVNLGDLNVNLGAQELTKFVSLVAPEKVIDDLNRGSTPGDSEDLDLSALITAPMGVEAAVFQVFFWDSAPAGDINTVLFGRLSGVPTAACTAYKDRYQPVTVICPLDENLICKYIVSASGEATANLQAWLVGYFEKVAGVGTQNRTFTYPGLEVAVASAAQFDLTNFLNRGLCHYLKVEETGGLISGTYDVKIYGKDTFLEEDLLYHASGISPATAYEDWLPFWVEDRDEASELHVEIANADLSEAGTFTVTLRCEQFA